jgi:hypothetical protein
MSDPVARIQISSKGMEATREGKESGPSPRGDCERRAKRRLVIRKHGLFIRCVDAATGSVPFMGPSEADGDGPARE